MSIVLMKRVPLQEPFFALNKSTSAAANGAAYGTPIAGAFAPCLAGCKTAGVASLAALAPDFRIEIRAVLLLVLFGC